MRQIIFSVFIIVSALIVGVRAQTVTQQIFDKGIKAAAAGQFETALVNFKASLGFAAGDSVKDDFLAKIHFNIGVCLYRLERNPEAVAELEEAVKLSRGDYEKAFYALGMAQTDLKNWRAAERAFLEAIRLNNRNGETWLDLAFVYLAEKNYESARDAFQKAIEFKSVDSSVGRNNLGVILAMNGDFPGAAREFERAVKDSGGKLKVAERNLQFCRQLAQNFNPDLLAKLEFGRF